MTASPALSEGERLKASGMKRAIGSHDRQTALQQARRIAEKFAKQRMAKWATIDDVLQYKPDLRELLGNAAGSVFKDGRWRFLRYVKSERPSNHGRVIRVWQLKEE